MTLVERSYGDEYIVYFYWQILDDQNNCVWESDRRDREDDDFHDLVEEVKQACDDYGVDPVLRDDFVRRWGKYR